MRTNSLKIWLDRLALVGLGVGFSLYMLPGWDGALRAGFWATLAFTVLHIFTSHRTAP